MTAHRIPLTALVLAGMISGQASAEGEPRPVTLYIDFDGGRLHPGDDSAADELSCIDADLDYPGFYGSRTLAGQVTEEVRAILSPYAVRVVDERPPSHLPYTMVMVGGLAEPLGLDPGIGGYACEIDCGDRNERDTVLVFAQSVRDSRQLAQTIVHEAAHSWGLDHVSDSASIMNPTTSGADRTLADGCTPLADVAASNCTDIHAEFCGDAGQQDSVAELIALRGPSEPDLSPPQVEILAPVGDVEVVPGELIELRVEVTDDRPGVGWRYVVPELDWAERSYEEHDRALRFPEGRYTLRVEATDQAGNEASAQVTVVAGDMLGGGDSDGSGGSSEEGAADAEDAEHDEGGCRLGSLPGSWGRLALVLLVATRRRRRA